MDNQDREPEKKSRSACCSFDFPDIPAPYLLFIEFAFTFGTTIIYFADIVTDIITLKMYFEWEWYYAFGLSIAFIVLPSVLLAVLEFQFLKKTYGKAVSWKTVALRTILNVPFQLTVVWYHCQLTYTYMKNWLDHLRGVERRDAAATSTAQWYGPTTLERSRGASLASLNDLDFYQNAPTEEMLTKGEINRSARITGSQSMHSLAAIDEEASPKEKKNWWERLTREQWLSHLNKLKLSESMLESLPQLLINLYLIVRYTNTAGIQYVSAILSYLSLCGGLVRYDKTRKDNEADRWMVDRTLLHSRAFFTRLEWPQLLFISIYKGSFLAARILAFVYFTIYFSWYVLVPVVLHWGVLLAYLVYRWYPDFDKVTRQLQQRDYKYRAYLFLSQNFTSVFHASLVGIFIHVRPYYNAFLDQPYCYMFWYYMAYVTENIVLFLLPGIVITLNGFDAQLNLYQYYPLLATELILNVIGCIFCATYYLAVHKMRPYTAHAYPAASRALWCCCYGKHRDEELERWLPIRREWTVCKQAETSELFFLTKKQLKAFHQTYNTVARNDRLKGRAVECFIDDRCKIFYAPRSKLKKITLKQYNDATMRPSLRRLNDYKERQRGRTEFLEDDEFLNERMLIASQSNGPPDADNGNNLTEKAENPYPKPSSELSENDEAFQTSAEIENAEPADSVKVDNELEGLEVRDAQIAKPVRKPRVKSLRMNNKSNAEGYMPSLLTHSNQTQPNEINRDATKSSSESPPETPTRPPRSIDNRASQSNERFEPVETSSVRRHAPGSAHSRSPPPREVERLIRKQVQPPTPRRIDDAVWASSGLRSSPKTSRVFDDSTYRVSKHPASSKSTKRDEFPSTSQSPPTSKQTPGPIMTSQKPLEAGEIVNDNSGWTQTWI